MKVTNPKNIIIHSLFWKTMERGGVQGIQFLVQIVLARMLFPADYGTMSLVMLFVSLANIFVQSGFNTALIQKKDVDEIDFSSAFYLSLIVAAILYGILYFTTPYIADFYNTPELVNMIRALSITLFLGAFNSIQNAIIARRMEFRKLFLSSLVGIILSGGIGILMAYSGFGVWSLIAQQIVNQILVTFILFITTKWRPKLLFSANSVKHLFSYGWKILASTLIGNLYIEIYSVIIGKVYNTQMLGFYNRGKQFPQLIVGNIDGSIQAVMLPTLSAHQEDRKKVKDIMRRSIVTSSFIVFPMMIGLAVISEPLIRILLTEKWLPCVPFLQIFCFSYALWPIHTANLQAINALGYSNIFLGLEIIKKAVDFLILLITVQYGVYAMAIGMVISSLIATFINTAPNRKLLKYSYKEQWRDIIPSALLAIVMGGIISMVTLVNLTDWILIIIQIVLGIVVYILLALVFRLECFEYLIKSCKELILNKKNNTKNNIKI